MIEPVSLAAAAVGLLAPYLGRLAERVAEQTADAIADSALPAVSNRGRFTTSGVVVSEMRGHSEVALHVQDRHHAEVLVGDDVAVVDAPAVKFRKRMPCRG
jgi:hypothetical protein